MLALFLRDVRLGIRAGRWARWWGVLFFLTVIAVRSLRGRTRSQNSLARIGPAILWIGALLAGLLGLDRLFQGDREDGSLDLLILPRATGTSWPLPSSSNASPTGPQPSCRWSWQRRCWVSS